MFPFNAPTIAAPGNVTSGNWTGSEPTGSAAGDLLIACISYRSNVPFTLPAGWSICAQESTGNAVFNSTTSKASGLIAYIIRGTSAPSYVFTRTGGDVAMGRILRYPGPWSASPFDVASSATASVSSTAVGAPALTTTSDGTLLVALCAHPRDITSGSIMGNMQAAIDPNIPASTPDTSIPPNTDWTERVDTWTTSGADAGIAIYDAVKMTAGNTGAFSATSANSALSVMIVAAFKNDSTDLSEQRATKLTGYAVVNTLVQIPQVSKITTYATFDTLLRSFQISKTVAYGVFSQDKMLVSKFRPYAVVAPTLDSLTVSRLRAFAVVGQSAPEIRISRLRAFAIVRPSGGRRRVILMIT